MLFLINFKNTFISISLDILDIEVKEDSDIDESKNFNIDVQTYLTFKGEYEEFIVIRINFNIIKRDNKEHFYNEDDLYFESNNIGHYSIIQMNYIYNYYIFYLRFKAINNFFFKIIFKSMKKVYREEETKHQIFITKTTIYRTFILSLEHPLIYIKKETILERYQKPFCLKHYLEKAKE